MLYCCHHQCGPAVSWEAKPWIYISVFQGWKSFFFIHRIYVLWNLPFGRTFDKLGPVSQSPETFRAHFGWYNSLCIFKTKASRITKPYSFFNFRPLCNTWKDQLYRISRSEFYEWVFWPEKSSGLSRNANPWTGHNLLPGSWQHLEEDNSRCAGEMFGHRVWS